MQQGKHSQMGSFAITSVGYLGEEPMSSSGLLGVSVIGIGEVSLGLQAALSGPITKAPGFAGGYLLHLRSSRRIAADGRLLPRASVTERWNE
jgi:hypothetical protein